MTESNLLTQLSQASHGTTRPHTTNDKSPWASFLDTLDLNPKMTERETMDLFAKTLSSAKSDWKDSNDNTLLMHMASRGKTAIVKRLIHELYANVNATNKDGMTALHMAARGGFQDICSELLKNGSMFLASKKNVNGDTAADLAQSHGYPDVAKALGIKATSSNLFMNHNYPAGR
ncbi:MAG: ankyrin repeat domain-containing protein [Pseudomonadota bacterium]|nr:ankyrin repeat domain-containing protein [Pseudomonadota bacterium]